MIFYIYLWEIWPYTTPKKTFFFPFICRFLEIKYAWKLKWIFSNISLKNKTKQNKWKKNWFFYILYFFIISARLTQPGWPGCVDVVVLTQPSQLKNKPSKRNQNRSKVAKIQKLKDFSNKTDQCRNNKTKQNRWMFFVSS